jgi:FtsZ-binding cell division protein ZapB
MNQKTGEIKMTKINENLNEDIKNAQTHLENLKSERDDFQNRMTVAVNSGDSDAMIRLRRRQTEIPLLIEGGQIRLAQMELEADNERLPVLQAKFSKSTEPIQAAILKRDAAVLELNKLQAVHYAADEDLRDLNRRIGERTRELSRLIHLANPAEIPGTRLRNLNAT